MKIMRTALMELADVIQTCILLFSVHTVLHHKTATPCLTTFSLFTLSFIIPLRKLLEGEETRISTGISYPTPTMSNYSYQSRMYSSSSVSGKKEVKDDDDTHQQSSKPGKGSSQSDDSKKSDKIDSGDVNPTNQKT